MVYKLLLQFRFSESYIIYQRTVDQDHSFNPTVILTIMQRVNFTEVIARYRNGERDFSHVILQNADMSNVSLQGIIFIGSDLTGTNFSNSDLADADFTDCNLSKCLFDNAVLKNTKFEGANLTRASIRNVAIERTSFRKANFMWAHLCGNDLVRADLTDAVLDWSCLIGSNVTDEQAAAIPQQALLTRTAQHQTQTAGNYGYPVQGKSGYGQIQQAGQQGYGGGQSQGQAQGNYVLGQGEYHAETSKGTSGLPPPLQKKKEEHKEY